MYIQKSACFFSSSSHCVTRPFFEDIYHHHYGLRLLPFFYPVPFSLYLYVLHNCFLVENQKHKQDSCMCTSKKHGRMMKRDVRTREKMKSNKMGEGNNNRRIQQQQRHKIKKER